MQRQIDSLITQDQNEIDTKTDILKETQEFYQTLYQAEDIDRRQMHSNLEHIKQKLDQDDRDYLNRPISTQEIRKAITDMKNEKSPGNDGLTKEFYHHFFDLLKDELCELYNNIKLSKTQPASQKNAIVKLLFKQGDHRQLKNWRPISLLNIDYKILSKIMTNRLTNFMDKLVPAEQKCAVKAET